MASFSAVQHTVLAQFPWRMASFARAPVCTFFARRSFSGRITCLVGGFAQFSMARVQFRPRRASGTFFPVYPSYTFLARVLVRGPVGGSSVVLPSFPWRASSFVPDGRRALFFPCTRHTRFWLVYSSVAPSVPRRWFCPVFDGARPVSSPTGVGHFFSRVPVIHVFGSCTRPWPRRCLVGGFAQFSMARVQFRPRRASGTFFPVYPSYTFLARVLVRARVGASSVVLPSFPWRASSFVPDGRRAFFFPCTRPTRSWPVHSSVDVSVPRRWFCPVLHGARAVSSPTVGVHGARARRALFSRVPVLPVFGPCTRTWPRRCLVGGFAQFSMARVQFRPRRASGTFFPVYPSYTFLARVLVCGRVGASSVVLPSFPWRASSLVPDGRRALFSRVPVLHVFGPCTRPCPRRCLVGGFAQFSMARVQFRPRRASGTFFPCTRPTRFWPVYSSVAASVPRRWFCPVFHGARAVSSPTGVGHFFSRVPVLHVFGPCTRPWPRRCLVGGFAQFSMARVQFRPRRASGIFFPVYPSYTFLARVLVRARVGASSVVLPSFPWRASSFVPDGRRALFSRVPVLPVFGPCTRLWPRRCLVGGFAQFSMARVPVSSPTGVGHFFSRVPVLHVFGPCTRTWPRRCLVGGFAQFSMARVQFRPRRASGTFFPCTRPTRFWPVYSSVPASVPRRWFCPVFHGARPVSSPTGVGHFFPVYPSYTFLARVLVRGRVGASSVVLPSFPWRASSFVPDGRRALFFPCTRPTRFWPVYSSVPASVPRRWFCPVFHGARPVSSPTGVGHFFSRVPVLHVFGPCTRPCPRRCLVGGFAQFCMARVQFRPRRASGTFFPCTRPTRFWPVYSYVAASVPRRWFCPVFHGARPVSSPTGVGHFFPVYPSYTFLARVLVRGPRRCLVGGFAQFSMARVQFRPRRASGTFFPVYPSYTFLARVLVRARVGASSVVLPSFAWRASSFVPDGRRALFSRVPVLHVFGPCTRPLALSGDCVCHTRDFAISRPSIGNDIRHESAMYLCHLAHIVLSVLATGLTG